MSTVLKPLGVSDEQADNIATHHIETEWSPVNSNAIRAACTNCQTWFEAWCNDTDYVSVRRAQASAKKSFGDFRCNP